MLKRMVTVASAMMLAACGGEPRPTQSAAAPASSSAAVDGSAAPSPTASTAADDAGEPGVAVDTKTAHGIATNGANAYKVERAVVKAFFADAKPFVADLRLAPQSQNGKVVGLRLFGVRPDSWAGQLGLENGDILETVNGFEISSPEKVEKARAALDGASRFTLRLLRAGKPLDIDYTFE